MNLKTKVILLCCLGIIPPLLLPISPILIENNFSTSLIYTFTVLATISKIIIILALPMIIFFTFMIIIKNKKRWEMFYPPLVTLILSIPAWNLSKNLEANLYLKITSSAQKIIVKTETWIKETGKPPKQLNDLKPIHLKKIPEQPYPFFGKFNYFIKNEKPILYVTIPNPPFKNQYLIYNFKRPNDYKIIDNYLNWHLTEHNPEE